MIKAVHIVSVPYTGTRFLKNLLDANGYEADFVHTYTRGNVWQQRIRSGKVPVVIPIRDPMLHVISCKYRNAHFRVHDFDRLAEFYSPDGGPHFFRTDGEPEVELRRLGEFLGEEITDDTGWEPVDPTKDAAGLRRDYHETGTFKGMEVFTPQVGEKARAMLRDLGYTMEWL